MKISARKSLFHFRQNQRATAVAAGIIGNVIEWYDFALYGFMASVLSELFFPAQDPLVSLIATYGVFAVGFIMRPLGAFVFGWLGDTIGRSRTLLLSVAMMALPTILLGLLPTYGTMGVAAPILLILVRMVQGLSVGGEFSTSVTYLVETAPPTHRGIAGSWANIGSLGGMLLGSGAAALVMNVLPPDVLAAWGWRLPFLFGGALGTLAILIRRGLPESPHFAKYQSARCRNSPIREAFTCNRAEMAQGALFAAAYGALFYLALVYLPTWVSQATSMSLGEAMQVNTLTIALTLPLIPLAGWASDRVIRRTRILAGTLVVLAVTAIALFGWMRAGSLTAVLTGQLVLGLLMAVPLGVAPALFTELFPEEDRLSGYSIIFNVGLGIVGGLTPMFTSWLILQTGSQMVPAFLAVIAAVVGSLALLWMRDRSRQPLETTCMTSIHKAMASPNHASENRSATISAVR